MHVIILQSPLVQLNTAYPSGAYLSSFFKQAKQSLPAGTIDLVQWFDLSNLLFHRVFSPEGLAHIFLQAQATVKKLRVNKKNPIDTETAYNLLRFLSYKQQWIDWITPIKDLLCTNSKEVAHEFVRSAHVPRGFRMEQYLQNLERDVCVEDATILASLAIADLADFISLAYDKNFSLIHYASSLAESQPDFSAIENELNSPLLQDFLTPLLKELCLENNDFYAQHVLFCISAPFAGTITAAIHTARFIKNHFKNRAVCVLGGGFINTELRNVHAHTLFSYVDFISYDRGYGSFLQLFDVLAQGLNLAENPVLHLESPLYKIRYRCYNGKIIQQMSPLSEKKSPYYAQERKITKTLFPDYSAVNLSQYPKMSDDTNPMHRIWSCGSWIKAYLAYGCYWHRCSFCDTKLDYVHDFCMQDIHALFEHLHKQAEQQNVYGIHFVDEASPPVLLQQFALENCCLAKRRLSFWGNIRFEKVFSRDFADFLAYGGLTAVSGGIEIAVDEGMKYMNKGTQLSHVVASCAAFKEAGILVHAYMIFGYFSETPQLLIDSMEILRQFFVAGLLDSAFWHKFTLTKHSSVFNEWKEGKHKSLKPLLSEEKADFAEYEIHFEEENKSEKYEMPLTDAVSAWMHGEKLQQNVQKWFTFQMPSPSVAKDLVNQLIHSYEKNKKFSMNEKADLSKNRYYWLGSNPVVQDEHMVWFFMGDAHELILLTQRASSSASDTAKALEELVPNVSSHFETILHAHNILHLLPKEKLLQLRKMGLVLLKNYASGITID